MQVDLTNLERCHKATTRAQFVLSRVAWIPAALLFFNPRDADIVCLVAIGVLAVVTAIAARRQSALVIAMAAPFVASRLFRHTVVVAVASGLLVVWALYRAVEYERAYRQLPRLEGLVRISYKNPNPQYRRENTGTKLAVAAVGFVMMGVAAAPLLEFMLAPERVSQWPAVVHVLMYIVFAVGVAGSTVAFYRYDGLRNRSVIDDGRPIVLLLRSFVADKRLQRDIPGKGTGADERSLGDHVVTPLKAYGRIVAVTNKADGLPGEYVAGIETSDDWKSDIAGKADQASAIVLMMGDSPSLAWEIEHVASHPALRAKTTFVWAESFSSRACDDLLYRVFISSPEVTYLPQVNPLALRALRFLPDGTAIAFHGPISSHVFSVIGTRYAVDPRPPTDGL